MKHKTRWIILIWMLIMYISEVNLVRGLIDKFSEMKVACLTLFIDFCVIYSIIVLAFAKYFVNKVDYLKNKRSKTIYLKYSFINNAILLTTETIQKNGFHEVWRQVNNEHSIQILCFNPDTEEFQAFDRYHWMGEPYYEEASSYTVEGWHYKKDLWTPIKLHYTMDWMKEHIK